MGTYAIWPRPPRRRGRAPGASAIAVLAAAITFAGGTFACGKVNTAQNSPGAGKTEDFVPGEIIVWFDEDLGASDIDEAVAKTGGEITERSGVTPSRVIISVPAGEEGRYVDAYRKLKEVRAADKNYIVRALPAEGGGAGSGDAGKFKINGE
jgi:hypothetical protein